MKSAKHILLFLATWVFAGSSAFAQIGLNPQSNGVLAGYASVQYQAATSGEAKSDFTASFSPVFLYDFGDNFLFESELEFGLSGESTTTTLEYAQINYLGFEKWQIIGGKFLVPFGLFGERLHPTWINKLPNSPLLYGHAHGGVAEGGALLPILSDVGMMTRYKTPINDSWAFDFSAWISQGPTMSGAAAGGHDDSEEEEDEHHEPALRAEKSGLSGARLSGDDDHLEVPGVGFGVAFSDNNTNKMIGGRVGLVKGPSFEVYVSGFHAKYDVDNELALHAVNFALDYRKGGFDFKTEGIMMWQEIAHEATTDFVKRSGFYVQLARKKGRIEPVVRWSQLQESTLEGQLAFERKQEISFGVNYWLQPSIPVKLSYHADFNGDDHIFVQWAFGL